MINIIYNDDTNFPHKLLLTNKQFANLHKDFVNNLLANINYQKLRYLK